LAAMAVSTTIVIHSVIHLLSNQALAMEDQLAFRGPTVASA